ncbi:MAG: 23S rRNA (pseudouridine(1915)-N(3))-methyltransferase RlmH [Clostridiales bacterium]|nr:23S rRNA (pseudouridine(1915)-N(3))-methyltransferase RlmH [Clostridiales bacterium]
MTIKLCCVGKLKESYYEAACDEFIKRLSRYCTIVIREVADEKAPETLSPAQQAQVLDREGQRLLATLDERDWAIALVLGKDSPTSEQFAQRLTQLEEQGRNQLAFVIGGSLGLSPKALARCQGQLSLSNLTFPHRVARLILLEQFYRAQKIRRGETYHK